MQVLFLPFIIAAASLATILWTFGRPWWCKCGELIPWAWNPWSSHNSQHLLDFYSPSHLLHGLVFYLFCSFLKTSMRSRFSLALLVEAGWEILENSDFIINRYRTVTASLDYFGDSIFNSLSDLTMCAIGFIVASKISARASVYLFLLCEFTTMLLMRDGLLLNIIMLVCPVSAIKDWQNIAAQGGAL